MSEAPKKMWIHEGFWKSGDSSYWARDEQTSEEEIPYIRADLVEELREAVERLENFGNGGPYKNAMLRHLKRFLRRWEET